MQRTLTQKNNSLRTTPEVKNKLQIIKENSHLFNCIDKISADHDVYVTNTMIKVTYKKALKDQNASENSVDSTGGTVFAKSQTMANKKKGKPMETMSLSNNDISFITKSPKVVLGTEWSKTFAYHSTPKGQSVATEKKNKYVNGLNLTGKGTNSNDKIHSIKIKKNSSHSDGGNNVKKSKSNSIKPTAEVEARKKFLKGNNSVVKTKNKVTQKNSSDGKKVTVNKTPSIKLVKLDYDIIKNKLDLDKKGLKRKLSNTNLNVINKKIKISENKSKKLESHGKDSESNKMKSGKKPIMLVDPDLPPGWTRYIRTRNKGAPNEQHIVYIINPQGKKFQYKWKLRKYLEKTNSSLNVDQFFFGLYQKTKSTNNCSNESDKQIKNNNSEEKSREHSRKSSESIGSKQEEESSYETSKSSEGKELLLFDPDLPFGWKRIIHSNSNGKKQVHIISPDGKIFRRRYRLHEYLKRNQFSHYLNRFYFGLYPKKNGVENSDKRESEEKNSPGMKSNNNISNNNNNNNIIRNKKLINMKNEKGKENEKKRIESKNREKLLGKKQLRIILRKIDECSAYKQSDLMQTGDKCVIINAENEKNYIEFKDKSPMYYDPNLPKGWKRLIKMRSYGESAGRLEVVIVSPDGRKHRSKKNLEHYLSQNNLSLKAKDFDFHVFGKPSLKKPSEPGEIFEPEQKPENELSNFEHDDVAHSTSKKKFDKPVPELDIDSLKEVEISPEGRLINEVNGLTISVGLSSARNERRQRLPREEQEKQLKSFLSSNEGAPPSDGCDIPTKWIQTLIKCRGNFRTLETDAVSTLGEAARDFIKKLSFLAFSNSEKPDKGLRYEDVADTVHRLDSLSPLQTLIPKKITYKEYIKLNRPKQFLSFT